MMIDKDTKLIEKVKNEIEQWEMSANKQDRHYLVVTVRRGDVYDYYCHYFYSEWNNEWREFDGIVTQNFKINERYSALRYLSEKDNIKFEWVNEKGLRKIRRQTIQRRIDESKKSEEENNLKLIVNELKEDCGNIVSFHEDNTPLLLVCAVSTEDDYYYVGLEKGMKFHYETCVNKYSIINDEKIIAEMKEWQKENINEIKNAVYKTLFGRFDVPFTDFSIIFNEN